MVTELITVLIVEDHGIVREGIRLILESAESITVIGHQATGLASIEFFRGLPPHERPRVVVTDLELPDISGFEVIRQLKAIEPAVRVLILTMHMGEEYVSGMLNAGADGYVLKLLAHEELINAVYMVARGETAISPAIAGQLVARLRVPQTDHTARVVLSERERQILKLLATGATSKEIAQQLNLSPKTIQNQRSRLLSKLDVTNTAAAVHLITEQNLLP